MLRRVWVLLIMKGYSTVISTNWDRKDMKIADLPKGQNEVHIKL